jgi:hypothetical protein
MQMFLGEIRNLRGSIQWTKLLRDLRDSGPLDSWYIHKYFCPRALLQDANVIVRDPAAWRVRYAGQ